MSARTFSPSCLTRRDFIAAATALGWAPACGSVRAEATLPVKERRVDRAPADAGPPTRSNAEPDVVTLFLCGDVMTGRGVDQILAHPSEPTIHEPALGSALDYVKLAEQSSGKIPRRAAPDYPWGEALGEMLAADVRIANLETAVTTSDDWAPKGINYRMHPRNVSCLTCAKLDVCVLSNNHVLDWGRRGLEETLRTLKGAGISAVGAGERLEAAGAPAATDLGTGGRVLVFGMGTTSSGIPSAWAATESRPGVVLLEEISSRGAADVISRLRRVKRPGDLAVASIHWGANWGYDVPLAHRELAHALVDAGFDVVHGHSSHHAIGIEVHRDRPILYGCGDFLSDYEGISGMEAYRDDLPLAYFASFARESQALVRLEMAPFRLRCFRLERASPREARWLARTLAREGAELGTTVELLASSRLSLGWRSSAAALGR